MSFNLTRKTDYALVALTALAEPALAGREPEPLSARQIAERFDLPLPLLMNVLKDLHRAEILCSRRGAGGGYILCHDPAEVTLLRIIEATEGPVSVALCCDGQHEREEEPCACQIVDKCPNLTAIQRFNELFREFLAGISLRNLIQREAAVFLTRAGAQA